MKAWLAKQDRKKPSRVRAAARAANGIAANDEINVNSVEGQPLSLDVDQPQPARVLSVTASVPPA